MTLDTLCFMILVHAHATAIIKKIKGITRTSSFGWS